MRTKRKSLIEERYHGIKKRQRMFMNMVQERAAKMGTSLVPFLSNDLMFKIFLLLPVKSLLRITSVCKSWKKLINCAEFVEAYNSVAQTTPILLTRRLVNSSEMEKEEIRARNRFFPMCLVDPERPNTFHIETQVEQSEVFSLFPGSSNNSVSRKSQFMHFLEIEDGKCKIVDLNIKCSGTIVASCGGLILIKSMNKSNTLRTRRSLDMPLFGSQEKPGRLIIMNPMTRKFTGIPLGTLPSYDPLDGLFHALAESYGLVFSHSKGYKVVHLFKDKSELIACELFCLQTRTWRGVDGPSPDLFRRFGYAPISANGALYWLPDVNNIDYIVSMGAEDERFSVTDLPVTLGVHDRLIEMGGFLSFVSALDKDHVEVWVLKGLAGTEWVKQHTIRLDPILGYTEDLGYSEAAFALNAKEMVFRKWEKFYSYDFEHEEIKEIEIDGGDIKPNETVVVHSNNLATWEALEPMC